MKKFKFLLFLMPLCITSCSPKSVSFSLIEFEEEVDLHTSEQTTRFFDNKDVLKDNYLHYLDGLYYQNDYSKPEPVTIKYVTSFDSGKLDNVTVEVSEDELFSSSIKGIGSLSQFNFYNAKVGTTYYYRVSACGFTSDISSFTTEDNGFRLINIDGVRNVRDIGGNGHIKQGLVYRGSGFEKINDSDDSKITTNITVTGKQQILDLSIKTEVDLRKNKISGSATIPENCNIKSSKVSGVNYINLPMYYGGKNILTYSDSQYNNPTQIKAFFELIADSNNLPVYMHCSEGKDRTGCLSYLLEALLGESDDYLYRDYIFSNFANTMYGMKISGIDGYYGATLKNYKTTESTFSEVVYNYLNKEVSISKETLDNVINNLKI